ncbi:MAG TPA: hypothetical protein VFP84_21040 [Kofleriaceae bacterium]|nr:hypothetical protein [Kofleriaceae bacterium]
MASAFAVLVAPRSAAAQTTALQSNAVTNVSCAPSQNGTGHMICGEELRMPTGNTIFGGLSWQAQPTTTGAPGTEAPGTVHSSNITLPAGGFTGTPGCSQTADGSGSVICAVEGPGNGLYGIAIHPQPTQTTSALMPLLVPGMVISGVPGLILSAYPCTPDAPCNIMGSVASAPSCAPTTGAGTQVICAVVVNIQNVKGAAQPFLVGVAFDPRAPVVAGSNPAIAALPYTTTYMSNPSCVGVVDHSATSPQNAGNGFAACGIVVMTPAPWSTPTIFGVAFDPRSGYARGGLVISTATGFAGDPSCATPRDGSTEVLCAIGAGTGSGFGNGNFSTLLGFGFDTVARTTTPLRTLGAAPSGFWTGVGCASPNVTTAASSTLCAATTTTNQTFGVLFDPRTTTAPRFSSASAFSPPNGFPMTSPPACVSLNIVSNAISCAVVDSGKETWAFSLPSP